MKHFSKNVFCIILCFAALLTVYSITDNITVCAATTPTEVTIALTDPTAITDSRITIEKNWTKSTTPMGMPGDAATYSTTSATCNIEGASATFTPAIGDLVPGAKYWVWFFSPKSGTANEDQNAVFKIANSDTGEYQEDIIFNQRVASASQGIWYKMSLYPIAFAGDGNDYASITRGSATEYVRAGIVKFIPVTDELVIENVYPPSKITDPYFETTGTWDYDNTLKLGGEQSKNNWKQYTVASGNNGDTAKFKALKIKSGEYKVYFLNVRKSDGKNDTGVTFNIVYSGGEETETITLNHNDYAHSEWVQLGDREYHFDGNDLEYVMVERTRDTGINLTRVGAIKFVPVTEEVVDSYSLMAEKVDTAGEYEETEDITANGNYKFRLSLPSQAQETDRNIIAIVARYEIIAEEDSNCTLFTNAYVSRLTISSANPGGDMFTDEFSVTDYENSLYRLFVFENEDNLKPIGDVYPTYGNYLE